MAVNTFKKPNFFNLLSEQDQQMYLDLQKNVGSQENRYNRFRRLVTFKESFGYIRKYCEYKKEDQWKRYLVCGVCWHGEYVAINTQQLKILISKSKSTINDGLSKSGYVALMKKETDTSFLIDKIPFLKNNGLEFRQWTIRHLKSCSNTEKKENKGDFDFSFDFKTDFDDESADTYPDMFDFLGNEKNETEFQKFLEYSYQISNVYTLIVNRYTEISKDHFLQKIKNIKKK